MSDAVSDRLRERDRMIAVARAYVERLAARRPVVAAAVAGSVARGDFNVWSDVDVVVVLEELPARLPDRTSFLSEEAPPGLQPVGFTPDEFRLAVVKRNALAVEAATSGVILTGEEFLAAAVGA